MWFAVAAEKKIIFTVATRSNEAAVQASFIISQSLWNQNHLWMTRSWR